MHTISPVKPPEKGNRTLLLARPGRGRSDSFWQKIIGILEFWYSRARQRNALSRLDERLLRDIGVNRLAAKEEAEKPFWQA